MSDISKIPKTYTPSAVEEKIYKLWLDGGAFHAVPDERELSRRYVVMMPLPNVTGALHMGHAMDNVMQDLLIRWHRMKGDNTLWMPGTDHAGIATQAVVEKRLKELENITRHEIGREGLVKRIWEWKDTYQARIIKQQQRMGCSCDWDRQRFTMDTVCARAVRHVFFRMFKDGLIFRGKRLVNWDVFLHTTISDDEMYYETIDGHFWHLIYPVIDPKNGEPEAVIVATTRPETMLGDTAVAVHPDPEGSLRHKITEIKKELTQAGPAGKAELEEELEQLNERIKTILPGLIKLRDMAKDHRKVNLPLLNRSIPLILDEWAKPELGSGCVKITPAHDYNDYDVWMRHRDEIDSINILNEDGTLNTHAGPYAGMDRFAAREKVVEDLDKQKLLDRIEDRVVEIGHSDRSKTPIEPFLSDQWFIKMGDVDDGIIMGRGTGKQFKSAGLVQAAIDAVTDGRVKIHPERYKKTYLDWLAEKRDWPISRQLWWGHRIPVWSKTYEQNKLSGETLFADLICLCEKRQDAADEFIISFTTIETEKKILVPGTGLKDLHLPSWQANEDSRVDVCLLTDAGDLVQVLESHGFERDPDVLDTWFSSSLWPFSTLGWPVPETAEVDEGQPSLGSPGKGIEDCLSYYYPGSCLVTARDIITLWVARMVLAGLYCLGDIPFTDVFIHANILDGKGVRMSKSKGNGIDPVDIINAYGTDAMRYVLSDMQTGTQDIRLPVTAICPECSHHNDLGTTKHGRNIFCYVCQKCKKEFDVLGTLPSLKQAKLTSERFEIGRAFCTKLWNSARFAFMNMNNIPATSRTLTDLALEDRWILDRLSRAIREVNRGLEEYNPSFALNAVRDFFWSSFCDWYVELVKPRLGDKGGQSGEIAGQVLAFCLDQTLRLLHPFIPYITEHLWQILADYAPARGLGDLAPAEVKDQLINAPWPAPLPELEDDTIHTDFSLLQEVIRAVREIRSRRNVPPKKKLTVTVNPADTIKTLITEHADIIKELGGIGELLITPGVKRIPGSAYKLVTDCQIFVHDVIDDEEEKKRLHNALAGVEKEILSCEKKLGNEKFVNRAPEDVVQKQRDKLEELKVNKQRIVESLKELG
jgi:valyl-tRNA synthetase